MKQYRLLQSVMTHVIVATKVAMMASNFTVVIYHKRAIFGIVKSIKEAAMKEVDTKKPTSNMVVKGGVWTRQTAKPSLSARPLPSPSNR